VTAKERELIEKLEAANQIIAQQAEVIAQLTKRIEQLEEQLGQNSSNSGKPRLLLEFLGIHISLGAISAIERRATVLLDPLYAHAKTSADHATIKHTDGTSWRQAGVTRQLWTVATAAVSVFSIVENGAQRHFGFRSRQSAQLLADETTPDLLEPLVAKIRRVFRAGWAGRSHRATAG
jgi:hypothetical protein